MQCHRQRRCRSHLYFALDMHLVPLYMRNSSQRAPATRQLDPDR